MNRILLEETLRDLFSWAVDHGKELSSSFSAISKNEEFAYLMANRPYDDDILKGIIKKKGKRLKSRPSENEIRYLAYLVSSFFEQSDIPASSLFRYINIEKVLLEFDRFHSQDIEDAIFELCNDYLATHPVGKVNSLLDQNISPMVKLQALYPLKRFSSFSPSFDDRLGQAVYRFNTNGVAIFAKDPKKVLLDDYFRARYWMSNELFLFAFRPIVISSKQIASSFHFYEIYKDEIILIEPGKESIHITFRKSERGIGTLAGKLQQEA